MIKTYPENKPDLKPIVHGWLCHDSKFLLNKYLQSGQTVIEIGSWLGQSANYICDKIDNGKLYCVDTWKGSLEHIDRYDFLPDLYELFIINTWDNKDIITPVRAKSSEAIPYLANLGVVPDVVYIDASHKYEDVLLDITNCKKLFPNAIIVGDDWLWDGVQKAVKDSGFKYKNLNKSWCMEC